MVKYETFRSWNSYVCKCRARNVQLQRRAERGAILAAQAALEALQATQAAGAAGSQITDEEGNVLGSAFFPRNA